MDGGAGDGMGAGDGIGASDGVSAGKGPDQLVVELGSLPALDRRDVRSAFLGVIRSSQDRHKMREGSQLSPLEEIEDEDDEFLVNSWLNNLECRNCDWLSEEQGLLPWGVDAPTGTVGAQCPTSSPVFRLQEREMRTSKFTKRLIAWTLFAVCGAIVCYILYTEREVLGYVWEIHIWKFIMISLSFCLSFPALHFLCGKTMTLLRKCIFGPWQLLMVFDAIERPIPYFVMAVTLRSSFEELTGTSTPFPNFRAIMDCIIALILLWTICLSIGMKIIIRGLQRDTFSQVFDEIFILEDIANIICSPRDSRFSIWKRLRDWRFSKNYRVRLNRICGPLLLPLQRVPHLYPPTFVYSSKSAVNITDEKSLVAMADHVFRALADDGSSTHNESFSYARWKALFPDEATADVARRLFLDPVRVRANENESIDHGDIPAALLEMFRRRNAVRSQLESWKNLSSVVLNLSKVLLGIASIFVISLILGANLNAVLVTLTSLTVAFAFAFAAPVSRMVESVIFIFGTQPFLIGDRVEVDGQTLFVHNVELLSTTFLNLENRLLIYPNSDLAHKPLYNSRRTATAVLKLEFEIAFATSWAKLTSLRSAVTRYIEEHPRVWAPGVGLYACDSSKTNVLMISFWVETRTSWQNGAAIYTAKTALHRFIRKKIKDLSLEWVQPLTLVKLESTLPKNSDVSVSYAKP